MLISHPDRAAAAFGRVRESSRKGRSPAAAGRAYRRLRPFLPLLLLAACGSADPAPNSLERARTGALRVGFAVEPPYAFVDSSGSATGEAPVILRRVARELGIRELQWFPLGFHDLISALRAGRIDVVAAGLIVTPERSRQVTFSTPTACVRPTLVGRRPASVHGRKADDLRMSEGYRIAVLQGSVEQRAIERHPWDGTESVPMPDLATAVAAVEGGGVDAFVISAPTARGIVRSHERLVLHDDALPAEVAEEAEGCTAFAFRPGDAALTAAFDSVLEEFVGTPAHVRSVAAFRFTRQELMRAAARPPLPAPPEAD